MSLELTIQRVLYYDTYRYLTFNTLAVKKARKKIKIQKKLGKTPERIL